MVKEQSKSKKGMTWEMLQMTFHDKSDSFQITLEKAKGEWLLNALPSLSLEGEKLRSFGQLKADFETHFEDFELFWFSKPLQRMKESGLLVV